MNTEAQFVAVLLDQDSFFTDYVLKNDLQKTFPAFTDEEYRRLFREFEADGSLVAFNLESDGLDGETFDHETHGTLDMKDMSLLTGNSYFYSIGASLPVRLYSLKSAAMEAAVDGGLSQAARLLACLPIDSSSWTGKGAKLTFDSTVKAKLAELVARAKTEIRRSQLSNAQVAKADAYLDCALLLVEQADPDPDIIAELIRRALLVIGAIELTANLKSFFGN